MGYSMNKDHSSRVRTAGAKPLSQKRLGWDRVNNQGRERGQQIPGRKGPNHAAASFL